ncbi:hypothetical protein QCA50_016959 [Cerrena zonata]|uniref:Gag protein n=1 Tax=Cerrena zonata TaxID=2478898 RepID=A0AAW0FR82_9APHY
MSGTTFTPDAPSKDTSQQIHTFREWAETVINKHRSGRQTDVAWFAYLKAVVCDSNMSNLRARWGDSEVVGGMEMLQAYIRVNWRDDWGMIADFLTPTDVAPIPDPDVQPIFPEDHARVREAVQNQQKSVGDTNPVQSYEGPVTRKRAREQSGTEVLGDISPTRAPAASKRASKSADSMKRATKVSVDIPRYKALLSKPPKSDGRPNEPSLPAIAAASSGASTS